MQSNIPIVALSPGNPKNTPSYAGMAVNTIPVVSLRDPEQHDFIREDSPLNEQERKYCRCLLEVESKGRAYSPYGVCTKSTGAQVHSCSAHYDWNVMDYDMLRAYASLHKIDTTGLNSREDVLNSIGRWKASRGESF
jgi:hypothetical protein